MIESTKEINEGTVYHSDSFSYTQEDVNGFARISGDNNPIHLDQEYAKTSIFKRRIIHGYLGASIFSKVFATSFPGEGTIYLKQDLKFLKPMFTETNYTAKFTVVQLNKEKNRALIKTEIFNLNSETVVSGEALIQNNRLL